MDVSAGAFLLVLSIVTLVFNHWVIKQEIATLKAQLATERALEAAKANKPEKSKKEVAENALPFFIRDDRGDAQQEELMRKQQVEESYFDEVPGLGR